jgi:hypothetical protein
MARHHVPRRIPSLRSVLAMRPKMRASVGVMDAVASVAVDGDAGAILGASNAVDVAAAEVLPELKNGGAPPRAAILPMVKLGCVLAVVSLVKLVAVAGGCRCSRGRPEGRNRRCRLSPLRGGWG